MNHWLLQFETWVKLAWVTVSGAAAGAVLTYLQAGGKVDLPSIEHAAIGGAVVGLCGLFINSPRNKKDSLPPAQGVSR